MRSCYLLRLQPLEAWARTVTTTSDSVKLTNSGRGCVSMGEENLKTVLHSQGEQFAIPDAAPAHPLRGGNFVADQCVANLNGHALVEQNLHAASYSSMRCCP